MKAPRREPGVNPGRISNGAGDVPDGCRILPLLAHGGFYGTVRHDSRYHVGMDASPLLVRLLSALRARKLEAVLIGNAAAALHGAPVTTLDFDFLFRDTATNLLKLKRVAKDCHAMILRPFYPVSKLYRMVNDDLGLQADFMPMIHGIRSFEGVRARAAERAIGGLPILVASLNDIIASKQAAGRDRDLAVLPVLKQTLEQTLRASGGKGPAQKRERRGPR